MAYKDFLKKHNIENEDNPRHFYDYKSAYEAGEEPDATGHWPSKYKHDLHPNRYIQQEDGSWLDTKHMKLANQEDVIIQGFKREEYLWEWENITKDKATKSI